MKLQPIKQPTTFGQGLPPLKVLQKETIQAMTKNRASDHLVIQEFVGNLYAHKQMTSHFKHLLKYVKKHSDEAYKVCKKVLEGLGN